MKKKMTRRPIRKIVVPKECFFCKEEKEPSYTDIPSLQKLVTDRGKIVGRLRNGLCARHQRHLTIAIKHARHLALMPYVQRD
jgi:small subunit ribosomal protein S18